MTKLLRLRLLVTFIGLFISFEIGALFGSGAGGGETVEKTLVVTGAVDLEIASNSGDITIRKGEPGSVQVIATRPVHPAVEGTASSAKWEPPIRQDGNRIRIGSTEGEDRGPAIPIDYQIKAPAQTRLTIQTTSGDLSLEGLRGPMKASTGSGDIRVATLEDGIEARTGSGDVTIGLAARGRVELETGSGDVLLHLPSQGGFDLTAHTSSGDISIASGLSLDGKVTEHDAVGKLRGGGSQVAIRTGSGDIRID
jgi:hypothetical protein